MISMVGDEYVCPSCGRWVVEVDRLVLVHADDDTPICLPAVDIVYLTESAVGA